MFLATSDDKLIAKSMKSEKTLKVKKKVHGKGGVKGVVFMPHINFIASSGGKVVKIWS